MRELPSGWMYVNMLDIIDYQGGSQPPKKEFIYEPREGYVRLLQIRDFGNEPFPSYVPDNKKLKKVTEDDLLLARYGGSSGYDSLGRICTGMKGAYNVALVKLVFSNKYLDKNYIKYLFMGRWFTDKVSQNSRSCQTGFNRDDLQNVIFPLPPLNEQRRIVAKLEKLLTKVNACKERLEKIPTILKRFRQSVLAAACSGRLTADWREHKSSTISKVSLAEVCLSITDGDHQAPPKAEKGIPFITISAINDGTLRLEKATRYVSTSYFESLSLHRKPAQGDILFSVTGSIGIPVIVDTCEPFIFQRHIAILKVNRTIILEKYLLYILRTEEIQKQALEVATGTAQLTIPLRGLRNFKIPLPPLPEQQEIVRRVEALFKKADAIEERYEKTKAYIDKITQSILAKAFRGELVSQDPNDEPASVLLERIRQEKAEKEKEVKAALLVWL